MCFLKPVPASQIQISPLVLRPEPMPESSCHATWGRSWQGSESSCHATKCVPKNCRYRLVECHPVVFPNCAEVTLTETSKFAVCRIYGPEKRSNDWHACEGNILHIQNEHRLEVRSVLVFGGVGRGVWGKRKHHEQKHTHQEWNPAHGLWTRNFQYDARHYNRKINKSFKIDQRGSKGF